MQGYWDAVEGCFSTTSETSSPHNIANCDYFHIKRAEQVKGVAMLQHWTSFSALRLTCYFSHKISANALLWFNMEAFPADMPPHLAPCDCKHEAQANRLGT